MPGTSGVGRDFVGTLNRLAGTSGLAAAGAANAWAGTSGKELVGALNAKAGTTGLELNGVCQKLALANGGSGALDAQGALDSIPGTAASFDPLTVAGLVGWYKSDGVLYQDSARTTLVTADADPVGSWSDASGLGNHLLQATSGLRPTYKTGQLNSKPAIRCAATGWLAKTFTVGAQPNTYFVVSKRRITSSGSNWAVWDGVVANEALMRGAVTWDIYALGAVVSAGAVDANAHVFVALYKNTTSKFRVDGGAGSTGNSGAATPTGLTLGAKGDGTTILDGDIHEALVFHADVSLADINSIGGMLATKYGLTWTTAT